MMTTRILTLIGGLAMLAGGCANNPREPDAGARRFLGLNAVNVLNRPTAIEGFNYRAPDGTNLAQPLPKRLDLSVAAELRGVLFDEETYELPGRSEGFSRDAGFKVYSDERSIEVSLSFANDQLQVRTRGPGGQAVVQHASFAPARKRMLQIVRGAMPEFQIRK